MALSPTNITLASNKVNIYPCAYRGQESGTGPVYDAESRLNSEKNIVNAIRDLSGDSIDGSFVISFDTSTKVVVFRLKGYRFVADLSSALPSSVDAATYGTTGKVYAYIKTEDITVSAGTSYSGYTSIILVNPNGSPNVDDSDICYGVQFEIVPTGVSSGIPSGYSSLEILSYNVISSTYRYHISSKNKYILTTSNIRDGDNTWNIKDGFTTDDLEVNHGLIVNNDSQTPVSIQNDLNVGGSIEVNGDIEISDDLYINDTLSVGQTDLVASQAGVSIGVNTTITGNTTISGTLEAGNGNFEVTSQALTVGQGNLEVTQNGISTDGDLTVEGDVSLHNGDLIINSQDGVKVPGNFEVGDEAYLPYTEISGNLKAQSNLNVDGNAAVTGSLSVSDGATITGGATINNGVTINRSLFPILNPPPAATINGETIINGNLNATGEVKQTLSVLKDKNNWNSSAVTIAQTDPFPNIQSPYTLRYEVTDNSLKNILAASEGNTPSINVAFRLYANARDLMTQQPTAPQFVIDFGIAKLASQAGSLSPYMFTQSAIDPLGNPMLLRLIIPLTGTPIIILDTSATWPDMTLYYCEI